MKQQVTHHESKLPRAVLMEATNPTKARLDDSDANEGFHPDEVLDNGRCMHLSVQEHHSLCFPYFVLPLLTGVLDDPTTCGLIAATADAHTYRTRSIAKVCIKCAERRRTKLHTVSECQIGNENGRSFHLCGFRCTALAPQMKNDEEAMPGSSSA